MQLLNQNLIFAIHYGEIALKGKNRRVFEGILIKNILASLVGLWGKENINITKLHARLILTCKTTNQDDKYNSEMYDKTISILKKIFGIEWFSRVFFEDADLDKIKEKCYSILSTNFDICPPVKVLSKRVDKSFFMTSPELSREVGIYLENKGIPTTLTNPKINVLIEVLPKITLISFEKISGLGGLPFGSGGKAISLLSGGIDSPVSTWLMMKRGVIPIFLHFHAFDNANQKEKTKHIRDLILKLKEYSPNPLKLYLAPYIEFYKIGIKIIRTGERRCNNNRR